MIEEKKDESTRIDVIWDMKKLDLRFLDILDMIGELKAKDKSLSARIARLKLDVIGNIEDEPEWDKAPSRDPPEGLDNLTVEQRALLVSKLLDRQEEEYSQ